MYIKTFETNALAKKAFNNALRDAAKNRLIQNRAKARLTKCEEAAFNRKAKEVLDIRIKDWERMRADNKHDMKVQMRIDGGGFHKPGSLQ